MSIRHLLTRVHHLEQARAPVSSFERWFGSLDAFRSDMQTGVVSGEYDATDMPVVIASIDRWHREGRWAR